MSIPPIELTRIYDETTNVITRLFFNNIISSEEMNCLLSILDIIVMGKGDHKFIEVLLEWQNRELDKEIDEIIKATLLNIDFGDRDSMHKNTNIIKELLDSED